MAYYEAWTAQIAFALMPITATFAGYIADKTSSVLYGIGVLRILVGHSHRTSLLLASTQWRFAAFKFFICYRVRSLFCQWWLSNIANIGINSIGFASIRILNMPYSISHGWIKCPGRSIFTVKHTFLSHMTNIVLTGVAWPIKNTFGVTWWTSHTFQACQVTRQT